MLLSTLLSANVSDKSVSIAFVSLFQIPSILFQALIYYVWTTLSQKQKSVKYFVSFLLMLLSSESVAVMILMKHDGAQNSQLNSYALKSSRQKVWQPSLFKSCQTKLSGRVELEWQIRSECARVALTVKADLSDCDWGRSLCQCTGAGSWQI